MRRHVGAAVLAVVLGGVALAAFALVSDAAAGGARGRAAISRCVSSGLVIWVEKPAGNAAAGSRYYFLRFTNLSGHACTLRGYPGVSAVSLSGGQMGPAALRGSNSKAAQTLANGATVTALLKIAVAGIFQGCHPQLAAGLKVYPPGDTASKIVPFPLEICSHAAVMGIGEVGPSTNTELEIP